MQCNGMGYAWVTEDAIAQVLRKMSLKLLASIFLMNHLSQTFESYERVKIYTYSVNDLGLKKFLQ